MARYREKNGMTEVDAVQWDGTYHTAKQIIPWMGSMDGCLGIDKTVNPHELEIPVGSAQRAKTGDFVVKEDGGSVVVIGAKSFESMYEGA